MNKADRDRENVAHSEMHHAYVLLKLGVRAILDLHERHPDSRRMLQTWVDHHERVHQEVWDELLAKVRAPDILAPNPQKPTDEDAERMLATLLRSTAQLEQVLAWMRDIVQTRPDRR